ncbi:alpha-hydroxy-acid oxidizing protein [Saccharomonospora piscinae]|uniref:lactate 2-monooxygenase n=1 Tax=Saccharomonospora piscinae TaxID=687388 RepID=UPI001105D10C|nr:lactate 2-monooxygenase [Saccharomonospora piscinae]TLW91278.1 alpha-hydroxy-acid oxidizing protein [Saccharomonospora piscinae]
MNERFGSYQSEIYLQGYGGTSPAFTTDLTRVEAAAEQVLEPGPFSYVAGGAGSGSTARANREAFDRWRIVPRMLTGATERDTSVTVLGETLPAPVALAPVGVQSIVHADAEAATARAAAGLRLPMVLSTASSTSIEEVAAESGAGPRWFQLYWPNDPDVCGSILARARAAGYSVLVVTLDTWSLGWRPCDLDNGYLPFLRGEGTAVPFSDPVFRSRLDAAPEDDLPMAVLRWISMITGTDRDWDALPFLREHWDGPIVLKGIQHVDDARRAARAGVDGIVVSNHGGRQVDGAVAALDVLPEIAAAVGDRLDVLFDSGVRTGADVVKALALGAKAVLLGRPWVYGLALGGEDGVRHVLRGLLADLDLTLGLAGHRSVTGLTPAALTRAGR